MIHHVGIVSKDASRFLTTIGDAGGVWPKIRSTKYVQEWDCSCTMHDIGGETLIEIVIPGPNSVLNKWIAERGATTLHHVAIRVDDIRMKMRSMRYATFVSTEPVRGVEESLVNFVHPSYCGVLVELIQCAR